MSEKKNIYFKLKFRISLFDYYDFNLIRSINYAMQSHKLIFSHDLKF